MKRYALNLAQDLSDSDVKNRVWFPPVFLGRFASNTHAGIGKYLAYFDKYLLTPILLLLLRLKYLGSSVNYHICDHSNAPYRFYLPRRRTGITCHDVLAIRGAFGYEDAYCPATRMGVLLQKWILRNLVRISRIATVSQFTLNQLLELAEPKPGYQWRVIYNTFNAHFYPMDKADAHTTLKSYNLPLDAPFILHVGSALPRKNRKMLVEMLTEASDFKGNVFFVGQAIDVDLASLIKDHNLEDRVFEIQNPDHMTLVALYSLAFAFVFPSFSEGFGWPIIEAQACGTPVITSALNPMQEVGGEAAIYANPNNSRSFSAILLLLEDRDIRARHIEAGFENIRRFEKAKILERFLKLYQP